MICEKCNKVHNGEFGSGRFCSRSCANSNTMTSARREKISAGVKKSILDGKVRKPASQEEIDANIQKVKATWIRKLLEADFNNLGWDTKRKRVILEQDGNCNRCKIDNWLREHLTLEVDHIDGNNKNDSRNNLEALCPNCHSLTDTWRGRNKKPGTIKKPNKTDEERVRAYLETGSIRQALIKLNLAPKGANYGSIKRALSLYNIDY